ncbi:MAG: hypothetical protein ACLFN1_10795 [Bacteroidales bacterium]
MPASDRRKFVKNPGMIMAAGAAAFQLGYNLQGGDEGAKPEGSRSCC